MAQTGHLESLFAFVTQSHKRLVKSENVCFVVYHVRSFPRYQEITVCRMQDGILAIFFDVGSPAGADCSRLKIFIQSEENLLTAGFVTYPNEVVGLGKCLYLHFHAALGNVSYSLILKPILVLFFTASNTIIIQIGNFTTS